MANVITLLDDERLQYGGPVDLKELYTHAHRWLTWRKFDVSEKKYAEKPKAGGKEYSIEWLAEKNIDEYSKYAIKVRIEIYAMNDVEVKKGNQTVKLQKGDLNIYVTAEINTDRQNYWTQNWFYSFMRSFYDRYLYRNSIERMKGDLWKIGWDYFNELKAFVQLYQY